MLEGVVRIPSMKDRCSAEEWQARIDLAACYRLVDLYGMSRHDGQPHLGRACRERKPSSSIPTG